MTREIARTAFAWAIAACAALSWASGGAPVIRAEPEIQPYSLVEAAPKVRRADASLVHAVALPKPAAAVIEKSLGEVRPGVPMRVGFDRDVAPLADGASSAGQLRWTRLDSGANVAAFSVSSPGAAAIRVALRVRAIPAGTLLRFYAPGAGPVFEVSAEELQENVGRNLAAGLVDEKSLRYWSPVIDGETAVVEIELPRGASPAHLDLAAPAISHLMASPANGFGTVVTKATAGACENDVTCYAATWNNEMNAVARMLFQDSGSSWYCTGTLVVDLDTSTTIPWFLSANHCIDNQAAATSLQTYWFDRSSACNSTVRNPVATTLTGGATLIYNNAATDTSLMRLASSPPGGAMYAGWSVGSVPGVGASVTDIHHPQGDLQKITFGSINSYASCSTTNGTTFTCRAATGSAPANFIEAVWNSGATEPGSSGSGLFTSSGHYLIGQLYGGTTSCTNASGSDFFGRFDVAYTAGLSKYLGTAGGGSSSAPTQDYSAMWWNPSESGWGMSITQHGTSLFAAWYVYSPDGSPVWLVMPGGTWTSSTSVTGAIYTTTGTPFDLNFDPGLSSTRSVGTAAINFQSVDRGVLTYTVNGTSGTKAIQRESFGVPDSTPIASYADLWWSAAEPGWGLSINQQYHTLFSVVYTYGAGNTPVWYVMPGGTWNGNGDTYSGPLFATSMPPFDYYGGVFDTSKVRATPVGTMSLQFSGTANASLHYTVNGETISKVITREAF